MASKINLARTLSVDSLTVIAVGSIQIALTLTAIGIAIIAIGAGLAVRWLERFATLAPASFLFAMASGIEEVALTSCENAKTFKLEQRGVVRIYSRWHTSVSFQNFPAGR